MAQKRMHSAHTHLKYAKFIPLMLILAIVIRVAVVCEETTLKEAIKDYHSRAEYASPDGVKMVPIEVLDAVVLKGSFFKRNKGKNFYALYIYDGEGILLGQVSYSSDNKVWLLDRFFTLAEGSPTIMAVVAETLAK